MLLPLLAAYAQVQKPIKLTNGLVISHSCKIIPKTYLLPTSQGSTKAGDETIPTLKPAIKIQGSNITVDFAGATIQGTTQTVDPDQRKGLAIEVTGSNVTLKNLNVHGYKVGLIARNANGLKILNSDFSYNWKRRLLSTLDKEDLSDWMSYHHNENSEWLRYGAGVYLQNCNDFEVAKTTIQGGQCGLMLVNSNRGKIWNNNFSFLSGVGLGLYRSSNNTVMHNKIDWCVRGYSHGVYNRGQDSAGILIFEQCNANTFAYNSVTHGGDGFFLWSGQTTMDTGKGGCNDNLLYGNDFSHAPTNGIEATFSRNKFVYNKVDECWHGVWGGFSYDTIIKGNFFSRNEVGIAIEHGQANTISDNRFVFDKMAVQLWENDSIDPNWGYGKYHDVRSRDPKILSNVFLANPVGISLKATTKVEVRNNRFYQVKEVLKLQGNIDPFRDVENINAYLGGTLVPEKLRSKYNELSPRAHPRLSYFGPFDWRKQRSDDDPPSLTNGGELPLHQIVKDLNEYRPEPLKGGMKPFIPEGALRGRKYILVDNWGPYDFKSPLLWPRLDQTTHQRFEVLGPKGYWKLVSATGAKLSAKSGTVPGFVDAEVPLGQAGKTEIVLKYVGGATTDYRGIVTQAGKPVLFKYSRFFAPISWNVKFYTWDDSTDPRTHLDAFEAKLKGEPIAAQTTNKLDYAGYAFLPSLPKDHYATKAEGDFTIPKGTYVLDLTTDDGAKVWLDGKLIISDAWKYQGPTLYSRELKLGGKHHLRVEHFQIDGYAALKVNLKQK